jgi:transcriptional regulator with XRE-family HTH domain
MASIRKKTAYHTLKDINFHIIELITIFDFNYNMWQIKEMNSPDVWGHISISTPGKVRKDLGQWLRQIRQRREWTLPMLASRSGVPVSTLSRLEREGHGGVDALLRVFQALGLLDEVDQVLRERLRLSSLPADIKDLDRDPPKRQRVRTRKSRGTAS